MAKSKVPKPMLPSDGSSSPVSSSPSVPDVVFGSFTGLGNPSSTNTGSVDHLSSGSSLQITMHKLNGKNYLERSHRSN